MAMNAEDRHNRDMRLFGGVAGLASIDDYVNRIADAAPPLTAETKARLRVLLRPTPTVGSEIPVPASLSAAA